MTNFNYLAGIRPLRFGLTCCDSWHPKFDPAWNALGVMNSGMLSWILMTVPAYSLMSFFLRSLASWAEPLTAAYTFYTIYNQILCTFMII